MTYPTILTYGQRWHEAIDDERHRQERLKAEGKFTMTCADAMSNGARLAVLMEEVGEVARAILERGIDGEMSNDKTGKDLQKELVQVAAVCVAWLEGLDRGETIGTENSGSSGKD